MLGNCLQSSSDRSSPKIRSEKVLGHPAYSHCSALTAHLGMVLGKVGQAEQ